jgi:hypothetical protein
MKKRKNEVGTLGTQVGTLGTQVGTLGYRLVMVGNEVGIKVGINFQYFTKKMI